MIQEPDRDFIRVGRSLIHGQGVFAKRKIPMGTRVIEYTGELVPTSNLAAPAGTVPLIYTMRLDGTMSIDATRGGSDARFINHSCAPNCEAYVFDGRLYIYAMTEIVFGEELTLDYKLTATFQGSTVLFRAEDYPCHCGAKNCRGTMLAEI